MSTIDPRRAPAPVTAWLDRVQPLIEAELQRRLRLPELPSGDPAGRLADAVRYAALGPGKRLRPALVVAACEACGGAADDALAPAAAVELLHAYTLVHDDLPAMDDDEERRGRATVHIEFDEATAILSGDALLTFAFGALADLGPRAAAAVAVLARRAGALELLAGQARDLALQRLDAQPSFAELEGLHAGKTGALFSAAAELGAIAAGAGTETRGALARYGMCVGVAFQHADDRDDGDFAEHAAEADARRMALADEAQRLVEPLGEPATPLVALASWIGEAR